MPNLDGKGPRGEGPKTGIGKGKCSGPGRPRLTRRLNFDPTVTYFKPRGVPLRQLEEVIIEKDELEALKLHDLDGLEQTAAAKEMQISQPTFARILASVHKKLAKGIINGQAIQLSTRSSRS